METWSQLGIPDLSALHDPKPCCASFFLSASPLASSRFIPYDGDVSKSVGFSICFNPIIHQNPPKPNPQSGSRQLHRQHRESLLEALDHVVSGERDAKHPPPATPEEPIVDPETKHTETSGSHASMQQPPARFLIQARLGRKMCESRRHFLLFRLLATLAAKSEIPSPYHMAVVNEPTTINFSPANQGHVFQRRYACGDVTVEPQNSTVPPHGGLRMEIGISQDALS